MSGWMILWTGLLTFSTLAFAVLVLVVGCGAVRELKESLEELRYDTQESAEHPETLDEAVE